MRPIGPRQAVLVVLTASLASANYTDPSVLDACPGYKITNVHTLGSSLTANLALTGKACNVYGPDIEKLALEVTYETSKFFVLSSKPLRR